MDADDKRYHPRLMEIQMDWKRYRCFYQQTKEAVRQNSRMYLSEIISNYYRLYSKEPMSRMLLTA